MQCLTPVKELYFLNKKLKNKELEYLSEFIKYLTNRNYNEDIIYEYKFYLKNNLKFNGPSDPKRLYINLLQKIYENGSDETHLNILKDNFYVRYLEILKCNNESCDNVKEEERENPFLYYFLKGNVVRKLADCELKDLISGDLNEEIISGYICDTCKKQNSTTIKKIFIQLPKYIVIFLDREKQYSCKFNTYYSDYELVSLLYIHNYKTIHASAYVKNSSKWVHYNDNITPILVEEKEILSFTQSNYILIYKKIN